MKLELNFSLKSFELPIDYRRIMISFIKKSLSQANDGKFYDQFYKDTISKGFTFSAVFPSPDFQKNKIILQKPIFKLIFSVIDQEKIPFILYSSFLGQKNKVFPLPNNNEMKLNSIIEKKVEKINSQKIIIRTAIGSGLCIRDHNREKNEDNYYIYSDENFQEKMKLILKNQGIHAGFSENIMNELRCKPLNCKKIVVKHYNHYINISAGMFQMEGQPEVLNYFLNAGMGSRHSAGFGLIELVAQDLF